MSPVSPASRYQFERQGYCCADYKDSHAGGLFSTSVGLRDTWAKIEKAEGG